MFLLYTLVTGVAAAFCLLAIWVAVGRGHWFARACVLLAALALLVPIRAYEPLILFGMTSMLLVAVWGTGRFWQATRENAKADRSNRSSHHMRFRMLDILLFCAVSGGASWLISTVLNRGMNVSWWQYGLEAALLSILVSAAVGVVHFRRKWLSAFALLTTVIMAVAIDGWILGNWLDADELLAIWRDTMFSEYEGLDSLLSLYGALAGWSVVLSASHAIGSRRFHTPAGRWAVRGSIVAIALPAFLLMAAVYWQMLGVERPPAAATDRENVLPHVLALARELPQASPDRARQICSEAVELSNQPGFIPIEWSRLGRDPFDLQIYDIQAIRDLGRQLKAEADAKRAAGKYDEAAADALATIRLGAMFQREGLIIHHLVGEAICGMGKFVLVRDRGKLTREQILKSIRLLDSLRQSREPIDAIDARDRLWCDHSQTWRYRLQVALETGIWGQPPYAANSGQMWDLDERGRCYDDLLRTELAVRAYKMDHGAWPTSLAKLCPAYLENVPLDAYSGDAFLYRIEKDGFVLYSVGADRRDDGGEFADLMTYNGGQGYDFDLDTMIRP